MTTLLGNKIALVKPTAMHGRLSFTKLYLPDLMFAVTNTMQAGW